ncbi:MAG TPA: RNA polymerase sigma factor [Terriglobales bacterium]|nr:RNA polymerase sigma factor [Terriglobales bacterium]
MASPFRDLKSYPAKYVENLWNYSLVCCEDIVKAQNVQSAVTNDKQQISMDKYENQSDAELLRISLLGDENAFCMLYEKLKGGIFRYAFYMTNSKSAAEEITQEVFIALIKDGGRYQEREGDVGAFAFGIARNFVKRMERRERPYQPLPNDQSVEEAASQNLVSGSEILPEQLIRGELIGSVRAAIASLPEHYRQVVVLCDLCELSYAEAACRLDCAVGTIRSRLNRAHALLAHKLKLLGKPLTVFPGSNTERCPI